MEPAKSMTLGSSTKQGFYPVVDVLRALSVLAVVLYHAGFPGIGGGYVGVDVFFVISGFLIIGQIVAENRRGPFSYTGFWARRALRILPTYLLVILASTLGAMYILVVPDEFREFGRQVAWSAGMVVNHLFLNEQGYFDAAAETKPLLHLWSLAVEEQFYLVAPIVLAGLCWLAKPEARKARRVAAGVIVAAMFAVSFVLCVRYTGTSGDDKNYAFYLMPLRAWEFILGGAVPFLIPWIRRLPRPVATLLMAAGLALILGAILGFGHDTPFPSWRALLPAGGAMLVIACGLAHPRLIFERTLAVGPVLWIGLISYAWYLWHWPLMAFSRIYNFGELPLSWGASMALLSMLLAGLSYRLIELPIKRWRTRHKAQVGAKPIIVGAAACLCVVVMGNAVSTVLTERAARSIAETMLPRSGTNSKHCRLVGMTSAVACRSQLRKEKRSNLGIVIGDSHARMAYREIAKYGRRHHDASTLTLLRLNCTPLRDVLVFERGGKRLFPCHEDKARAYDLLDRGEFKPRYAVIYSRWNAYTPWRTKVGGDGGQRRELGHLRAERSAKDQRGIFIEKMRETIGSLQSAGVRRILIIGPTPEFYKDVWSCSIRADHYGKSRDEFCSVPLDRVLARRQFTSLWLQEALSGQRDVRLIDPMPVFCDDTTCRGADGDVVLYRDNNHIVDAGMRKIIEFYKDDFDWLME
jgi:peptidoglycan/LPS O-acetylase OafA/YrhL